MNRRLRFAVFVFILAALLLGAIPASAGNKTLVTGLAYWGVIEPSEREWIAGQYNYHERNQVIHFIWETSDPRLDGYIYMVNNTDWHYDADWGFLFGHIWAYWTVYADPGYTIPLWDCTDQGTIYADWSASAKGVCNGVGENQGTHVDLLLTTPDLFLPYMDLQAWINE